ncbi:MAG: MFS transporter, partial [Clostridia bacterium]|nr:MFS transporter [Clostridia bacterium]
MPEKYKKTVAACCLGYVTQSAVVNLAPLFFVIFRRDLGFSYSFIAALVFMTFAVQITVDALSVRFMSRIGYRRCAILSQIISAVGIALLGILPGLIGNKGAAVMIAVIVYSVGGGLIEVVISPIIDALPKRSKGGGMAFLHSFYSWGQVAVILLTTLSLRLFGESAWYTIAVVWAALPVFNTFMFAKVPIIEPVPQSAGSAVGRLFRSGTFILVLLLMICAGAAEQVMAQWASLFCEKGLGVEKVVGDILGPCLFAAFMGIGRTFYGVRGEKIRLSNALIFCSSLAVVCYLLTVFS